MEHLLIGWETGRATARTLYDSGHRTLDDLRKHEVYGSWFRFYDDTQIPYVDCSHIIS